jgi:DNA polymerase IV
MRILCLLLPHFSLNCEIQRDRELAGRPVAITFSEGAQKLVLDYAPQLKGLQRGMVLQQAISLYGDIEVTHADMPHYWSNFNGILDALELKSPLVEGTDLGEVYIGVDGLHLLYADDEKLVSAMREAIPDVFETRIGIARGKFPAHLCASQCLPGTYKAAAASIGPEIQDISCDILPVSLKTRSRLHDFGLSTLGQLTGVSPAHLQAQFGPEGQLIWELANGQDDTPLYPRLSEQNFEDSTVLGAVTTSLDLLMLALESMLSRAFIKLSQRGMGIRRITMWTQSWISEHWEKEIRFKEPAMNTRTALLRIKQVIENELQPGPVEQLGIKITGTGRLHARQNSLISQIREREHLFDDIKQMEMRLGAPQLFKLKEVEPWSRIPERRHVLAPLSQ